MAAEPNSRGHFKSFLPTVFLPVPLDPSSIRLGAFRVFHLRLVVTTCGVNTFNITAASYFKRPSFLVQASPVLNAARLVVGHAACRRYYLSTFRLEGRGLGAISLGVPGAEALPPPPSKENTPISQRDV